MKKENNPSEYLFKGLLKLRCVKLAKSLEKPQETQLIPNSDL